MPKGGKRAGAGRKAVANRKTVGGRVALLVRIDKSVEEQIEAERVRSGGKSLSSTIERLLRTALVTLQSADDAAEKALGFVVAQAAQASSWQDRTWRNDRATLAALKLALPAILDLLAQMPGGEGEPHPFFQSTDEHARFVYLWTANRLKERGDEYGTDWPADHPLRNFPKAAAALNLQLPQPKGGDK